MVHAIFFHAVEENRNDVVRFRIVRVVRLYLPARNYIDTLDDVSASDKAVLTIFFFRAIVSIPLFSIR